MGCVARLDYFWDRGNWAEAGAMRCSIVTWNCLSGGSIRVDQTQVYSREKRTIPLVWSTTFGKK